MRKEARQSVRRRSRSAAGNIFYASLYFSAFIFMCVMGILYRTRYREFKHMTIEIFLLYFAVIYAITLFFCILFHHIYVSAKDKNYRKTPIYQIDHMDGEEFEKLIMAHFRKMGLKVYQTQATNDYGADLILERRSGVKTAVQIKRYKNKVTNTAVQEVTAAMKMYGCTKGMVITNSYFTKNARNLAAANDIILWDRNDLIRNFKIRG